MTHMMVYPLTTVFIGKIPLWIDLQLFCIPRLADQALRRMPFDSRGFVGGDATMYS